MLDSLEIAQGQTHRINDEQGHEPEVGRNRQPRPDHLLNGLAVAKRPAEIALNQPRIVPAKNLHPQRARLVVGLWLQFAPRPVAFEITDISDHHVFVGIPLQPHAFFLGLPFHQSNPGAGLGFARLKLQLTVGFLAVQKPQPNEIRLHHRLVQPVITFKVLFLRLIQKTRSLSATTAALLAHLLHLHHGLLNRPTRRRTRDEEHHERNAQQRRGNQ